MKSYIKLLLSIFSAGLLIISFKDNFSFIAWFALIPYFLVISSCTLGWSVFLSWLTGICFFAGITYWFTTYSFVFWFPILGILSLSFIVFGIAFYFVYSKIRVSVLRIMLISSIWAAVEFFRHRTFLAFPWGVLGYSQHNYLAVMQISKLTGVVGVSILILLLNLCIAELLIYFLSVKKPYVFYGLFYYSKGMPCGDSESKECLKTKASLDKTFAKKQKFNFLEQKQFRKKVLIPAICISAALIVNIALGAVYLALNKSSYTGNKINVALVQPNITFDENLRQILMF